MTAWDTEDDLTTAAQKNLPSPSNSSRSAQARLCRKTNSPPSSLLSTDSPDQHKETDFTNKENAFPLDPHDFAPSLNANLVSEILALRRAQEAKKRQIESLETILHETKNEFDLYSAGLASINKENNSLKRKLELIENSTSSALLELSKERDSSLEIAAEAKQRLEAIQRKVRKQDGEIDRIHALWARDKASWEEEKRKMNRKLHVAENRLKKVVEEVTAFEAHKFNTLALENEIEIEDNNLEKNDSDIESFSTRSRASSIRFSVVSGLDRLDGSTTDGLSLADELNHVGVDATCGHTVQESFASISAQVQSQENWPESNGQTYEKCLAADNGSRCSSKACGRTLITRAQEGYLTDEDFSAERNGILFRDPHNPSAQSPNDDKLNTANVILLNDAPRILRETASDQTQQREDQSSRRNDLVQKNALKNNPLSSADTTETQTSEEPLNLSIKSTSPCCKLPRLTETIQSIKDVLSRSTQTDEPTLLPQKSVHPVVIIPSIQLHPPQSTPGSPDRILLSPQFKDKSCQVEILSGAPSKSVSVQTEEINIDQRTYSLPLHPHPSSTESNFPHLIPKQKLPLQTIFYKTPDSLGSNEEEKLCDEYSKNHNNGSPSDQVHDKKLCAISVPAPGFKTKTFEDGNKYLSRNSVPAIAHQKHLDGSDNPVWECDDLSSTSLKSGNSHVKNTDNINSSSSLNNDKNIAILREKNSILETQNSPSSETNSPQADEPPFPIPVRHSSRRPYVPLSYKSDDIDFSEWAHKSPCHRRSKSIRKIRSATAISERTRTGSFSEAHINMVQQSTTHWANNLPITSISPLPNNEMISSRKMSGASYEICNSYTVSGNASNSAKSNSMTSDRTTSVISAIAQSMIGEWVFKYTRQRKPASATDSCRSLEISNKLRHRRWIWLAPYERTVMWSSKEPTSRSALMGKCGRKLVIQSVLDVKDENPPPKGINLFHRSILIHSSNRALRFTAVTKESHNNWLKALTFLARSQLLHGPLSSMKNSTSNKPQSETRHKTRIQDTICIAKGRPNYASKLSEVSKKTSQSFNNVNHIPSSETSCMIVDCDSPADAPIVPRFSERSAFNYANTNIASSFLPLYHRRRSNTAPRNPPSSTHKINNPVTSFNSASSSNLAITAATHENNDTSGYNPYLIPKIIIPANLNNQLYHSHPNLSCNANQKSPNSEDSSPENYNFFDPIGTVRMQAFVSPSTSVLGSDETSKTEDEILKIEQYFRCQEPEDKNVPKPHRIGQIDLDENFPKLKSLSDEVFIEKYPKNSCVDTCDNNSYLFSGF